MFRRCSMYGLLIPFIILVRCTDLEEKVDHRFKLAFDVYKDVYPELLSNPPFDSVEPPGILAQLPVDQLRSGDVILRLNDGASSILSAFSSLGGYSHVGILIREQDALTVVDCQPHNAPQMGGHSIKKHRLSDWVTDIVVRNDVSEVLSVLVMRCNELFSRTALESQVYELLEGNVEFDSAFRLDNDVEDKRLLYCSEFIYVIYQDLIGRDDFIFFSDTITNQLIERAQVVEKENRYPEFFRMLHVIESRFKFNIHHVERLISPSAFEYSSAFQPVCFARHPGLHDSGYLPLLTMYAFMQRSILVLRALHGLPTDVDLKAAFDYAGLNQMQKRSLRKVISTENARKDSGVYNSDRLIFRLLDMAAGAPETFDMAERAIAVLEPPEGHGE